MRNLCLTIIVMMINVSLALSQQSAKSNHDRLQTELSWKQYQKKWFRSEMSKLKEIKKIEKEQLRAEKKPAKRVSKMNKYRQEIAAISVRKEGNDE